MAPNGEVFWQTTLATVSERVSPDDSGSKSQGGGGLAEQLAERVRLLETQLQRAQRLEAVGQLAGGIVHDFNNLLTAILAYTELAEIAIEGGESAVSHLNEIRKIADQAGKLTLQLLTFTRAEERIIETVDPNDVVASISRLLRRLIGEDVDIRYALTDDVGLIQVDRAQLSQIIINLAVNARQAMPGGGTLTIGTQARPGALGERDAVCLSVGDTGVGIPMDLQQRIFEPLFTTKAPGQGTGLGLATVRSIVEEGDGRVNVESEVGAGARFDVLFPRVEASPSEESSETELGVEFRAATILVVEDDVQVAMVVRAILEGAGHKVLTASDGEQAMGIVEQSGTSIEVVVTDVVLPKMSGFDVVRRVRSHYPRCGALFSSGYGPDQREEAAGFTNADFLPKPFSRQDLLERVDRLLERAAK